MQKNSLLTAIIFTYNHEDSIGKCIESIVNQKTDYKYEIHIWDDCSIDDTSNICRHYAEKYPDKIKLVIQKENTFLKPDLELQSYAAIHKVETRYLCYIDGDDYWCDENKLQIALDFLENNPEYIGFAHDTLHIDEFNGLRQSYIHDCLKCNVTNPVTLSHEAPFFLASSRIFRKSDYEKKEVLPIDYLFYYYHLSKGPIYYYDKIMACYVVGENNTFANLGKKIRNLNSMFPYKLALLFDFEQDEFCTKCQEKYDTTNGVGNFRYKRLCFFKKLFGIKLGWTLWFIFTFVFRYGYNCININYVYSRRKAKKYADENKRKHKIECRLKLGQKILKIILERKPIRKIEALQAGGNDTLARLRATWLGRFYTSHLKQYALVPWIAQWIWRNGYPIYVKLKYLTIKQRWHLIIDLSQPERIDD